METKSISRRDLLKSTGVLIVGFSFFGSAARVLAQGEGLSVDGMDPTVLDSWMAISKDWGTSPILTQSRRRSWKSRPRNAAIA